MIRKIFPYSIALLVALGTVFASSIAYSHIKTVREERSEQERIALAKQEREQKKKKLQELAKKREEAKKREIKAETIYSGSASKLLVKCNSESMVGGIRVTMSCDSDRNGDDKPDNKITYVIFENIRQERRGITFADSFFPDLKTTSSPSPAFRSLSLAEEGFREFSTRLRRSFFDGTSSILLDPGEKFSVSVNLRNKGYQTVAKFKVGPGLPGEISPFRGSSSIKACRSNNIVNLGVNVFPKCIGTNSVLAKNNAATNRKVSMMYGYSGLDVYHLKSLTPNDSAGIIFNSREFKPQIIVSITK